MMDRVTAQESGGNSLEGDGLEVHSLFPLKDVSEQLVDELNDVGLSCTLES